MSGESDTCWVADSASGGEAYLHSPRCDYPTSGECYCPGPGERAVLRDCGHLVDAHCGCEER